jgi:cholesterol transport system auxiliary component
MKKLTGWLVVASFLTACSGILPEMVGEPPALYELAAPEHPAVPDGPPLKSQLLVDIPQSSAGIDSPRIALTRADGTLAYYKDVSWTDRAPVMFQTLLVSTFDHSGRMPFVGRENIGLRGDFLLKSDLGLLQADYSAGTPPLIRVGLRVKLVTMPRRVILSGSEFTSEIKAEADNMEAVSKAFRQATDDVLSQLVTWTVERISETE